MYRARTKKQELRRRLLTYTVAPVIVTVGVALLVLYIIGYRYNSTDHRIEQGGLIQFITQPTGAKVEVDGVKLPGTTNTRLDATAGSHTVVMTRPGYLPWQKTVTVEPGKLLWLNYVRMIPKDIDVTPLLTLDSLATTVASYQRDKIVLLENATQPVLSVVDLSSQQATVRKIQIDQALYDRANGQKFLIDSIDRSGRYVAVKVVSKTTQWMIIDLANPDQSQNISTITSSEIGRVLFFPNDINKLYVVTKNMLRRVDLRERMISAPLVSDIRDISISHTGVIAYVTTRDQNTGQSDVGYYTAGASRAKVLRRVYGSGEQPMQFRIGEYSDGRYGVLRVGDNLDIFSFPAQPSDDSDDSPTNTINTIALPEGSDFLSISPSGRFIMSQESSTFITYDLELKKVTTATLKGDSVVSRQLQWLDDTHIWSDRGGKLYLYEFDGENAHAIDSVRPGQAVLLSRNGKQLWYIDTVNKKSVIKSAQLVD